LGVAQIGALILQQLGFGVVVIVGVNLNEVQTNYVVIE
jgi:hypothetical protein